MASPCDDGAGIHLSSGEVLLHQIAQEFSSIGSVTGMAIHLLQGVGHGGYAFVQSQIPPGAIMDPRHLALRVMVEWCTEKPEESYGGKLVNVISMSGVNPEAAMEYRARLVPEVFGKRTLFACLINEPRHEKRKLLTFFFKTEALTPPD